MIPCEILDPFIFYVHIVYRVFKNWNWIALSSGTMYIKWSKISQGILNDVHLEDYHTKNQKCQESRVKKPSGLLSTTPFLVKFLRIGFGNQTWTWANLNCDPRCQLLILLLRGPRLSADEFHLLNWGCIVIRENLQGNLTYIIQF